MGKKGKPKVKTSKVSPEELPKSILERFDTSKPQFRKPKEDSTKIVIDERFAGVLTDPRYQVTVADKYGRRKKRDSVKEQLSAFYTVAKDDEIEPQHKNNGNEEDSSQSDPEYGERDDEMDPKDDKEADADPTSRIAYLTALSRGELDVSSSSDEGEDDDSESKSSTENDSGDDIGDLALEKAGILDPTYGDDEEIEITYEASPYLAVTNLDWDHLRSVDIFALLASFTPAGAVKSVKVYQSDFGMQRMKEEEKLGPQAIWNKPKQRYLNVEDEESIEGSSHDSYNEKGHMAGTEPVEESGRESNEGDQSDEEAYQKHMGELHHEVDESGFDQEKLREYEASKLKYYFAIVEFSSPEFADIAYKEVDGLEFERSSAAVDLRAVMPDDLKDVVQDRPMRDEAKSIPSNYEPPEFVVSALQQTNVQCTWEAGDLERERKLTKYTSGEAWGAVAETDDLKAYLASDNSSDEDEEEEGENGKASKMRKMLGLDSDEEEGEESDIHAASADEDQLDDDEESKMFEKEATFVPGQKSFEDKIRAKLNRQEELTPWEKYQEKRKQKRREKRQETRAKRKEINEMRKSGDDFKPPTRRKDEGDFFVYKDDDEEEAEKGDIIMKPMSEINRSELELLVAGDDAEDEARDYDMRGLARIEKNKDKKLRGLRKRKEKEFATNVSGVDFKVDIKDDRFKAVLDGTDDRFGIDRTDPNFKETTAMKEILAEQTRRRKTKRLKPNTSDDDKKGKIPDVNAESSEIPNSGAHALSSLVSRLKAKVSR